MDNPLEAVEAWLGEKLTSETARRLAGAPLNQIEHLRDGLEEAGPWQLTPLVPGQTRPLVSLDPDDDDDTWKSLIFLADDLATENPILSARQAAIQYNISSIGKNEDKVRHCFGLEVNRLLFMAPLVRAGVVRLFDAPEFNEAEWESLLSRSLGFVNQPASWKSETTGAPTSREDPRPLPYMEAYELIAELGREYVAERGAELITVDTIDAKEQPEGVTLPDAEQFA